MTTRDDAVRLLEDQHAELSGLLAGLDEEAFARRGTIGGGDWSAKDLAAHLGIWEELAIEVMAAFARGERPAVEDRFTGPGSGDQVNAEGVERFLDASASDVMARFEDLHRRVIAAIGSTGDEAWTAEYPFDPDDRTLGDRIGSLLGSEAGAFTHPSAHLPDLRAYVAAISR
ncbi:MAG TPA: DinB family protein [Actinomycetota bacterium]|nr:DinB family protein [Actinomycetota bacterium]